MKSNLFFIFHMDFKKFCFISFLFFTSILLSQIELTNIKPQEENSIQFFVKDYGLYSVQVESDEGTSFQIVDRVLGPGKIFGKKGVRDGHASLFLDQSDYQIKLFSHSSAIGKIRVHIKKFQDQNHPPFPVLLNNELRQTQLHNFKQFSYWIYVPKQSFVYVEAVGRCLQELRIWKNGDWMTDDTPYSWKELSNPEQPKRGLSIKANLAKGYYRITAYGGDAEEWSRKSKKMPFALKYSIEEISCNERFADTISSLGHNRYLVPSDANYFLLQTKKFNNFSMTVKQFNFGDSLSGDSRKKYITKKSKDQQCSIYLSSKHTAYKLITVTGTPGEKFILQTLEYSYNFNIRQKLNEKKTNQTYWLSVFPAGYLNDDIDVTALLTKNNYFSYQSQVIQHNAQAIGFTKYWKRTFNLLQTTTLYFYISISGLYTFAPSFKIGYSIKPLFNDANKKNIKGKIFSKKHSLFLEKGFYILTLMPGHKGILTFTITPTTLFGVKGKQTAFHSALQLENIVLDSHQSYSLIVNNRRFRKYGLELRPYPLTLTPSLPVILHANETLHIDFQTKEKSVFHIRTDSDLPYFYSIDGQPFLKEVDIGNHKLTVINKSAKNQFVNIKTTSVHPDPLKLKKEITKNLMKLPEIPKLSPQKPYFFNLGYNSWKTFLINISEPTVYTIQTTGLLKTKGTLRTRIQNLDQAEKNGPGDNFIMRQYLKKGIYQLDVRTLEKSAGHLGLKIKKANLIHSGIIRENTLLKDFIQKNDTHLYTFHCPTNRQYKISSYGIEKNFPYLFETKDGWPLVTSKNRGPTIVSLEKGDYNFFALPSFGSEARITSIQQIKKKQSLKGKGPFYIQLNHLYTKIWVEKKKGLQRLPDVFHISIPASIDVEIQLPETMKATIYILQNKKWTLSCKILTKKDLFQHIEKGQYKIEIFSRRPNNYFSYQFGWYTSSLIDGISYEYLPYSSTYSLLNNMLKTAQSRKNNRQWTVILDETSFVQLYSQGMLDTRATLMTTNKKIIAQSDDSFNDWNFNIAKILDPGKYFLVVNNYKGSSLETPIVPTRIFMSVLKKTNLPFLLQPSFNKKIRLNKKQNILSIEPLQFLNIKIQGTSMLGFSINNRSTEENILSEKDTRIDTILSVPNKNYVASLWSEADNNDMVHCVVTSFTPKTYSLQELLQGVKTSMNDIFFTLSISSSQSYHIWVNNQLCKNFYWCTKKDNQPIVLRKNTTTELFAQKGKIYIRIHNKNNMKSIKFVPVILKPEKNKHHFISLNENPLIFKFPAYSGITVAHAFSSYMQPLITMQNKTLTSHLYSDISFFDNTSLSINLTKKNNKATLWNPENTMLKYDVKLDLYQFPIAKPTPMSHTESGWLKSGQSITKLISSKKIKLNITLNPYMTAFLWKKNSVLHIVHTERNSKTFSFYPIPANLTILNYGNQKNGYVIEKGNISSLKNKDSDILVETILSENNRMELQIPENSSKHRYLHFLGVNHFLLFDSSGNLVKGQTTPVRLSNLNYKLVIYAKKGFVKVWVSKNKAGLYERAGILKQQKSQQLKSGDYFLANGNGLYKFHSSSPAVLNLSASAPFLLYIEKNKKMLTVKESGTAKNLTHFIAQKGDYTIGIRSLGYEHSSRLNQDLLLESHIQIPIPLKEKIGPKTIISAKQSCIFTFSLVKTGDIGIALDSKNDVLEEILYNEKGRSLKKGRILFSHLNKGDYFVEIYNPSSRPVIFNPVIIGITPKSTTPSKNYIHNFLNQYGYIKEEQQ